jgi:hypothetical protein
MLILFIPSNYLLLFQRLLSSKGRCYLVLVEDNKPAEISSILSARGFSVEVRMQ